MWPELWRTKDAANAIGKKNLRYGMKEIPAHRKISEQEELLF